MTYPTTLDALTNPAADDTMADVPHHTQHADANDAIEALEAKLGIGASTPSQGTLLASLSTGASVWQSKPVVDILDWDGFVGDGESDDSAVVAAAADEVGTAGGGSLLLRGTPLIGATLELDQPNVRITGQNYSTRIVIPLASDLASLPDGIFHITASGCSIDNLGVLGSSDTTADNCAASFVVIEGELFTAWVNHIRGYFVNGSPVKAIPLNDDQAEDCPRQIFLNQLVFNYSGGPIYIKGNAAGGGTISFLSDIFMDVVYDAECYHFVDAHDVTCTNLNGSTESGAYAALRLTGETLAFFASCDLGARSQAGSAGMLLESSSNGSPKVTFDGGSLTQAETGIQVNAVNRLMYRGQITQMQGSGLVVAATSGHVGLQGATFDLNNRAAGTAYEIDVQNSGPFVYASDCLFKSTAVTAVSNNVSSSRLRLIDCNVANGGKPVFTGDEPRLIRGGSGTDEATWTTISVPASGVAYTNHLGYDAMFYVSGGTVSDIKVNGTSTGLTSGSFRVNSRQSINITYTGVPTVKAQNL